ncbi:hypothetical protein PR048_033589 [Dryococelus australis]|uniref:Uncharacterized protein n=1 Tax=Dryococelus australis TaxID=614101 RepID=A0ABQ9G0Q3_9NEOP|nr:hypothetical protein PR048_033589 [Dryococelus australis]
MERRRNERAEETGDLRENPPTNGIVRHDSHMRISGVARPGIEPGSPWWEASHNEVARYTYCPEILPPVAADPHPRLARARRQLEFALAWQSYSRSNETTFISIVLLVRKLCSRNRSPCKRYIAVSVLVKALHYEGNQLRCSQNTNGFPLNCFKSSPPECASLQGGVPKRYSESTVRTVHHLRAFFLTMDQPFLASLDGSPERPPAQGSSSAERERKSRSVHVFPWKGVAPAVFVPVTANGFGELSLWCSFLVVVEFGLHEAEEYPGNDTLGAATGRHSGADGVLGGVGTFSKFLESKKLQTEFLKPLLNFSEGREIYSDGRGEKKKKRRDTLPGWAERNRDEKELAMGHHPRHQEIRECRVHKPTKVLHGVLCITVLFVVGGDVYVMNLATIASVNGKWRRTGNRRVVGTIPHTSRIFLSSPTTKNNSQRSWQPPFELTSPMLARPCRRRRGKRQIPEKARRKLGAIPTCENPVTRPGIEPGSPWVCAESLTEARYRRQDCTPVQCFERRGDETVNAHVSIAPSAPTLLGLKRAEFLQPGDHLNIHRKVSVLRVVQNKGAVSDSGCTALAQARWEETGRSTTANRGFSPCRGPVESSPISPPFPLAIATGSSRDRFTPGRQPAEYSNCFPEYSPAPAYSHAYLSATRCAKTSRPSRSAGLLTSRAEKSCVNYKADLTVERCSDAGRRRHRPSCHMLPCKESCNEMLETNEMQGNGAAVECKGRDKREYPEKIHRVMASLGEAGRALVSG